MSGKQSWHSARLDLKLTPEDDRQLRGFANSFYEFWENWKEIAPEGRWGFGMELNQDSRVEATEDFFVSRHRLKGFLVDYRKFHLNKEQTNFFKVLKTVGKCSRDKSLRQELDVLKAGWSETPRHALKWHCDIYVEEFFDAYFNAVLFHSDPKKDILLQRVTDAIGARALLYEAYFLVWHRLEIIRNLNWVITPYIRNEGFFRVPLHGDPHSLALTSSR